MLLIFYHHLLSVCARISSSPSPGPATAFNGVTSTSMSVLLRQSRNKKKENSLLAPLVAPLLFFPASHTTTYVHTQRPQRVLLLYLVYSYQRFTEEQTVEPPPSLVRHSEAFNYPCFSSTFKLFTYCCSSSTLGGASHSPRRRR